MLDVDGTLAPIAPTPSNAVVSPATLDTLRRLAQLPDTSLALVSGRSAEDAWRLAGVEGAWVIGNHGFELRAPDGEVTADEIVLPFEGPLSAAARLLAVEWGATPGAIVEPKRWTLSLHYRLVEPGMAASLIQSAKEIARTLGLRVTEGKMVVELRPPVNVNKGTAAVAFAERLGALRDGGSALYAGDDQTDEDAFRALRANFRQAVTARVAGAAGDGSDATTDAELVLGSPDELRQVLEWLVLRRSGRTPRA
jgi:trehalose-phosphatase